MDRRAGAWILLFSFALAALASGANAQQKASASYDGHWWLSITPHEQYGFLNGFTDCYDFEYKGPDRYIDYNKNQKLITMFYEENASQQGMPVSEVLHRFRARPGEKPRPGGEVIKGRHAYYDGTYWKLISAEGRAEVEQRGFVEGYLACHAGLNHNKGGVFSKAPEEYVRLITQWYGFIEQTGDINAKREPTAIADALFRFRDRPQDFKPRSK